MSFSSSKRATRLTAGALFVLIGVVSSAPSSARAACSHYTLPDSERVLLDSFSTLELLRPQSEVLTKSVPAVPNRDVPCSGPTCSQGQGIPYIPAPLPPLQSESWCCTTSIPPLTSPELTGELADQASLHPQRYPATIERPPRILALLPSSS